MIGRVFLLLVCLSAMSAGVNAFPSRADEPSLLARATRVLTEDQPASVQGGVVQPWLSDHELLHFGKDGQLYRYDLNAKSDTPLPTVTHQVTSSGAYLDFIQASPSGQWIMWGQSSNSPIFVASINGAHRYSWTSNGGYSTPYWCADGAHVAQVFFGTSVSPNAFLHAADVSGLMTLSRVVVHDIAASGNGNAVAPQQVQPTTYSVHGMNGLETLGPISTDQLVARTPDPEHIISNVPIRSKTDSKTGEYSFEIKNESILRKLQHVSVWSLTAGVGKPVRVYTVQCPGLVQSVTLSPKGDRLAWMLVPSDQATGTSTQAYGSERLMLWTSALDGSGMQEVGAVSLGAETIGRDPSKMSVGELEQAGEQIPTDVQWAPDETRLSFDCQGALWVVPVGAAR